MKLIIDVPEEVYEALKGIAEDATSLDPYSLADLIVNKSKPLDELGPQGEWVDEGQYAEGHSEHAYICKKCGYQIIENPNIIFENRFCKYCGADMRKVGAEE